jgi:hypothetical protein
MESDEDDPRRSSHVSSPDSVVNPLLFNALAPDVSSFVPTVPHLSSFAQTTADASLSAVGAPSSSLMDLDPIQSIFATGSNTSTAPQPPETRRRRRSASRSTVSTAAASESASPVRRSSRIPVPSRRLSPSLPTTDLDSHSNAANRTDLRHDAFRQQQRRSLSSSEQRIEINTAAHIRAHAVETVEQQEARLQHVRERAAAVRFVPAAGAYVSGRPSAEQLENSENDPSCAQALFAEGAGSDTMGQMFGTHAEKHDSLLHNCQPVSSFDSSVAMQKFNVQMDPATVSRHYCAACGIHDDDNSAVCCPVSSLESLRLTSEQLRHYLASSYQLAYSVYALPDTSNYYYLHEQFVSFDDSSQEFVASLCCGCDSAIRKGDKPQYSIAAGFDFGNPAAVDLIPLSFAEQQLISRCSRYMHIFKLVLGQTAATGHIISLEHEGRHVLSDSILPHLSLDGLLLAAFVAGNTRIQAQIGEAGSIVRREFIARHQQYLSVDPVKVSGYEC